MIVEYALEPQLVLHWASTRRDYAECIREYGLGTPRLFSSFPKQKPHRLRSFLMRQAPSDDQSDHFTRYELLVDKIVESNVIRPVSDSDAEHWQEAVQKEHQRIPFGAILASKDLGACECLTPENMYNSDSKWNQPTQLDIQRTSDCLLAAFSGLLRFAANEIVIIDTFGWTREAIGFMKNIMQYVIDHNFQPSLPAITLFYKEKRGGKHTGVGSLSAREVKRQILNSFKEPPTLVLNIYELREKDGADVFHNRCILSEHGGISTGHGIGISGEEAHTDEATLLACHIYLKKWHQFVENLNFEVVSKAIDDM